MMLKKSTKNKLMKILDLTPINNLFFKYRCFKYDTNFIVLMYHETSKQKFKEHILYLDKHYKIISINDFYQKFAKKQFPSDVEVIITFDDGKESFYHEIYPVIEELGINVIHYLTAGPIFFDKPYLNDIFNQLKLKGLKMNKKYFSKLSNSKKNEIIDYWSKKYPIRKKKTSLYPEQIEEMNKSKFLHFGAHTISHPNLIACSYEEAFSEIKKSKIILEKELGNNIEHFAYPYGFYNNSIIKMVKEIGFKTAMTVNDYWVNSNDSLFVIPRVGTGPNGSSVAWLKSRIAGTFSKFRNLI